jgi:hypothetical protein
MNAQAPVKDSRTVPVIPFALASRKQTRLSFDLGTVQMGAAASTPISPVQIPAVGYLSHINLKVTVATTGAAAGTLFTADGPFNVLSSVEFKTAAGNDIIVPTSGYSLYLMNKWGAQFAEAPQSDAKASSVFTAATGAAAAAEFFLQIPLQIDTANGYGSIPALASNRSYQLNVILSAISTAFSVALPATATVSIQGTAHYWSEPPASTASGAQQATAPTGIGSVSQWQMEMPSVTPGDKLVKSNNVGSVLRTLIFVLRNSAGARIDADWPAVCELYLDNEPMFFLPKKEWEDTMSKQLNVATKTKDAATTVSLDNGVYVIPFHALTGGRLGAPGNSRAQYLPTVDASQLQIRGTSFGAAASTLEIITNSVIPSDAASLYSR